MVDVQSLTAEIRRGKKKRKKKPQGKNIMSTSAIRRAAIIIHTTNSWCVLYIKAGAANLAGAC